MPTRTGPPSRSACTWLAETDDDVPDLDRRYIEMACRSPLSVFVIERVDPGRSLDLKDVLTGVRFHVLEQGASQNLQQADLLFTRVLSMDGVSIMFGAAPFIVPPRWHTHIIDWRQRLFRTRLMTVPDLADFDIEIRDMYFNIAAELLDPTPPQLSNTDGDPLALVTLTYELRVTLSEAFERLAPLANVHGEDHVDDVTRDASGAVTSASLSWVKAGNRQHKGWDNTVLGALRLDAGRLVADVNSDRRAGRLKREIARRLGKNATLVDTATVDPSTVFEERRRQPASGDVRNTRALESSAEAQELEEEMRRQQWAAWPDTRVPALGNKTPRQATRTPVGRERLEALLAQFERDAVDGPSSTATHLASIRSRLGLTKPLA
jgi:hypothetical protein